MRHGAAAAPFEWQAGLCAIERLDLALLIDRHHHRMGRRINIEEDEFGHAKRASAGWLRSAMMASSRSRSAPVTSMLISVRMHSGRTMDRVGGIPFGCFR